MLWTGALWTVQQTVTAHGGAGIQLNKEDVVVVPKVFS